MVNIDDYNEVKKCYKDERYSAPDKGAMTRHPRECERIRKNATFGLFASPMIKRVI